MAYHRASDRVGPDRYVELALVDGNAEGHATLQPRRKRGNERPVERIQFERLGAVNPLTLQISNHLADVFVRVDGDPAGQLRGLVQPGGIGSTDVDPGAQRAGQVADGDRRLLRIRDAARELDAFRELHRVGQDPGDQVFR